MWLPLLGLLAGIVIASLFSISVPAEYAPYTAISILAALDSLLGAVRSELEGTYDNQFFTTGLISNMLLAALLTYLGDRLGVDLSIAAKVAFGVRLFNNQAIIRRYLLARSRGPRSMFRRAGDE